MKNFLSCVKRNPTDPRLKEHAQEKVLIQTEIFKIANEANPPIEAIRIKFLEGAEKGKKMMANPKDFEEPYFKLPLFRLLFYKFFI